MHPHTKSRSSNTTNIPDIGYGIQNEKQWSFSFINYVRNNFLQILILNLRNQANAAFVIGNIKAIDLCNRH